MKLGTSKTCIHSIIILYNYQHFKETDKQYVNRKPIYKSIIIPGNLLVLTPCAHKPTPMYLQKAEKNTSEFEDKIKILKKHVKVRDLVHFSKMF